MKAHLMHRGRDFDPQQAPAGDGRALMQDLELDTLLGAMAAEDAFVREVARKALLCAPGNDEDTVRYRQAIVGDCFANAAVVKACYAVAVEAIESKQRHYLGFLSRYPSSILSGSVELLQVFAQALRKLRRIADEHAARFESDGFKALFAMLRTEFDDEYLALVDRHLAELKFRRGVLVSAELGRESEGERYVLRLERDKRPDWMKRLLGAGPKSYTFTLHERDEAGARIVSEMSGRGINLVANALAQSADHVLSFFERLRTELAFYVGCIELRERLEGLGTPLCFPQPSPPGTRRCRFDGLVDVCLALTLGRRIVGNTVDADGKSLLIVTGANQGGKSTFLRSVGLAQLMMQAGLFVAAASFAGELCTGLYTHYRREEDAAMERGKLDVELARMSVIVDAITPEAMMLFNESFASTNELEGSEIARQIVSALLERRIKVFFVTHQYRFAGGFFAEGRGDALFLRAARQADGTRSFRLVEGEPLETSFGEDLYREVFERRGPAPVGEAQPT